MKRLLVGVGIIIGVLVISKSYADRFGMYGEYDGQGIHISTALYNNIVNMPIATGSVVLTAYHVLSTGTQSGLIFQQCYNPTGGLNSYIFWGDTVPYQGASPVGAMKYPTDYSPVDKGFELLLKSTSGWCVTKTGNSLSNVIIDWDYWR